MTAYCAAIMEQVQLQSTAGLTPTVDALLTLRRESIATTPIYALIEYGFPYQFPCGSLTILRYAYGLALPYEVIKHPSIQKIEIIATDIVLMYVFYALHRLYTQLTGQPK